MSDQDLRTLEASLKLVPDNQELRLRLLRTYLRVGKIKSSELSDLAALDDPAAIFLVGSKPDLTGRTKKFYLRCAFALIRDLNTYLQLEDFLTDAKELATCYPEYVSQDDLTKFYQYGLDAVEVFNRLMIDYLQGINSSYPLRFFRENEHAKLKQMKFVFATINRTLNNWWRHIADHHLLLDSLNSEREGSINLRLLATLATYLNAYSNLGLAATTRTKANCEIAINASLRAWDHFNQGAFLPQIANDENYFQDRAGEMLSKNRGKIIELWLPGYAP